MSTVRVRVRGPADKYTIWRRARDLQRWPRWMPLVRGVASDGPLRPGLEGEVVTTLGVHGTFTMLDVDDVSLGFTCAIHAGPIRLRLELESAEGLAVLHVTSSAPVALGCAPLARRGLRRLVAR